jgi:RNA polymerase sigma-70 factor (ECF subfamily)
VVLAAQDKHSSQAGAALEALCRAYWPPLYGWVRRQGRSPHDAQDLTQAFFARLLEKDWLAPVRREKGRFRTFLLVALKRFVADEWDKARAQKRGGGARALSLDTELAERLFLAQPSVAEAADRAFEREWAMTLLDRALVQLREEFDAAGKSGEYAILKDYLTADRGGIPYHALAQRLHTTPGTARVAVHRLRKRFRELFRAEITATVAREEDIEDELRQLLGALGR